ncbi:Zinc finger, CCHC-type superfamily, partial [Sesbania bispinosa]
MMNSNGFPANLPILDGKNYDKWCIQMRVIFYFQEVLEIVKSGYSEIEENSSEQQKAAYREAKKKDCKALFLIHQCVDSANFEKIADKPTENALQAQVSKKDVGESSNFKKGKGKWKKFKGKHYQGGGDRSQEDNNHKKNGNKNKGGKMKFDKRNIRCYAFQKMGHFAYECKSSDRGQERGDEAQLVHTEDSDSEHVLLM